MNPEIYYTMLCRMGYLPDKAWYLTQEYFTLNFWDFIGWASILTVAILWDCYVSGNNNNMQ